MSLYIYPPLSQSYSSPYSPQGLSILSIPLNLSLLRSDDAIDLFTRQSIQHNSYLLGYRSLPSIPSYTARYLLATSPKRLISLYSRYIASNDYIYLAILSIDLSIAQYISFYQHTCPAVALLFLSTPQQLYLAVLTLATTLGPNDYILDVDLLYRPSTLTIPVIAIQYIYQQHSFYSIQLHLYYSILQEQQKPC